MDRDALIRQALDEMTTHDPAKALRNTRHWPGGRLSMIHLNVLFLLDGEGPLPMRSLAESLDVSQASATGIVDRMEQRGLVERLRDDEDRRVIRVAPSVEGRRLVAEIAAQRRDHLAEMLQGLTDEELHGILAGARAIRRVREQWLAAMKPAGDAANAAAAAPAGDAANAAAAAPPSDAANAAAMKPAGDAANAASAAAAKAGDAPAHAPAAPSTQTPVTPHSTKEAPR